MSDKDSFADLQLLVRMVVAQDMWWWLRRICGGGCAGYVVGGRLVKSDFISPLGPSSRMSLSSRSSVAILVQSLKQTV